MTGAAEAPPADRVAIVLATNRTGPWLAEALDSVCAQSWSDWELVIVDDGSPEPARLDELATRMPNTQVVHRRASGLAMSRNVGIAHSTAPLVTFLDDDDVWEPDRLARLVGALRDHPEAVASYSSGRYIDEHGRPLQRSWPPVAATRDQLLSGAVDIPRIVALMVRREPLVVVGAFNPAFRLAEDDEFILRLLRHGPAVAVPEALVAYRIHPDNVTRAPLAQRELWSHRAIRLQLWATTGRGEDADTALLQQNLARFRARHARENIHHAAGSAKRHDWGAAGRHLAVGLRWSPRTAGRTVTASLRSKLRPKPPGVPPSG